MPHESQSMSPVALSPPLNSTNLITNKNLILSNQSDRDSFSPLHVDSSLSQRDQTEEAIRAEDPYGDHTGTRLLDNRVTGNLSQTDQAEIDVPGVRSHGIVLRSGRTHRDYLNARELARDLTRNPRSFIPVPKPDLLTTRDFSAQSIISNQSMNSPSLSTRNSLVSDGNPTTFGTSDFPYNPPSSETSRFSPVESAQQRMLQQLNHLDSTSSFGENDELEPHTQLVSGDNDPMDRFVISHTSVVLNASFQFVFLIMLSLSYAFVRSFVFFSFDSCTNFVSIPFTSVKSPNLSVYHFILQV